MPKHPKLKAMEISSSLYCTELEELDCRFGNGVYVREAAGAKRALTNLWITAVKRNGYLKKTADKLPNL